MAQTTTEVQEVKMVSTGKAIAIILVAVILFAATGTVIGKTFFWNNYKKVNREGYALNKAQEAVKADPMNPDKLAALGWAQYEVKDYDNAIKSYKQSLKYSDNNFIAYLNLGMIYLDRGQYAKSEENLKKAVELVPKSDIAHLNLGMLYIQQKKYKEARRELEIGYKVNPASTEILYNIALATEKIGEKEEALGMYKEAYSLDPKNKKAADAIKRLMVKK